MHRNAGPSRRRRRRGFWRRIGLPAVALVLLASVIVLYRILLGPSSGHPVDVGNTPGARSLERTTALAPLRLPQDDGLHVSATEWWYYSGHLFGPDSQHFSFHATVFLRDGMIRHTVFHGSIRNHTHGGHYSHQTRTAGIPSPTGARGFDFRHEGWELRGFDADHAVRIRHEDFQLALELTDPDRPVLHRVAGSATPGLIDLGDAGITYYYSRPRMHATGAVRIGDGEEIPVTGQVWFDHQWGDFEATHLGWNWFALQLDDGWNLMVFDFYDRDGDSLLLMGTRSDGAAVQALGPHDGLRVQSLGTWTSDRTGVRYPTRWEIQLPEGTLLVEPLQPDSEFDGRETIFSLYWEGAVRVSGVHDGIGFVELSGYDSILSGKLVDTGR